MPKFIPAVPFAKFRGRVLNTGLPTGQVAFDSPKVGFVSRAYAVPTNPESTKQTEARNITTLCAQAYKALTETQANAWAAAAAGIERIDNLGTGYALSGIGLYCAVNWHRLNSGGAQSATVPSVLTPPAAPGAIESIVHAQSAETLTISLDLSTVTTGDILFCRVTPPLSGSARLARQNDLRTYSAETGVYSEHAYIVRTSGDQSLELNVGTEVPSWVDGDRVGVEVRTLTSAFFPGLASFERNLDIEVTA